VEDDRVRLGVEQGVGGARVAIAGLADAAGVQDDAHVRVEIDLLAVGQAEELAAIERGPVFHNQHGNMRVTDEAERRLLKREVAQRGLRVVEVFPDWPAERAVDKGKVIGDRCDHFRERIEEAAFVRTQARLRPLSGGSRGRVEVFGADSARGGAFVVARDHRRLQALQARDALAGLRAVADAIAERPDGVDRAAALGIAEDSLEGDEVRVDVRDDEGAGHGGSIANERARIIPV
jgi:hypothetical protein